MPKDVELARDLTSQLNEQYTGRVKEVRFTYDGYVDLDNLPTSPIAYVTLENFQIIREGRGVVRRDASIRLTVISDVGPTDSSAWIDEYIDSFDRIQEMVFEIRANGHRPVDMEAQDRFDLDRFQSHHRLVMVALFNYRNI